MKSSPPVGSLESTIAKINNAVSQVPSPGPIKEMAIPPQVCGVYFLLWENEIIYIGQSTNIIQRICSHVTEGKKGFDRVLYLPCPQGLLDHYERQLIRHIRPCHNRQHLEMARSAERFIVHALSEAPDGLTVSEIVDRASQRGVWAQTPRQLERNLMDALQTNDQVEFSHCDWKYRLKRSTDGGRASIDRIEIPTPSRN